MAHIGAYGDHGGKGRIITDQVVMNSADVWCCLECPFRFIKRRVPLGQFDYSDKAITFKGSID